MGTSVHWPVFFFFFVSTLRGIFVLFWLKTTHIHCPIVLQVRVWSRSHGANIKVLARTCSVWGSKKHLFLCLFQLQELYNTVSRLPWKLSGKESACQCSRYRFDPWVRKIPWRRKWQPTPVFLPGKPHGQRSLAGYSSWGHKESNMIETKQQQQTISSN